MKEPKVITMDPLLSVAMAFEEDQYKILRAIERAEAKGDVLAVVEHIERLKALRKEYRGFLEEVPKTE